MSKNEPSVLDKELLALDDKLKRGSISLVEYQRKVSDAYKRAMGTPPATIINIG